jgi:hypothetical protein
MRFLRMATNALLAGAMGAAYLAVLLLQLNPHVPILSGSAAAWFLALWMLYGIHLAVAFYLLLVIREFFALDPFSPGWISVRLLAWFGAVVAALAATLMWLNLEGLRVTLDDAAARRMLIGATATTVSAVVLLGIAVAHYSFGRRGSQVGAALFVLAAFASLALPLAARGRAEAPVREPLVVASGFDGAIPSGGGPRIVMILLDGASLDYIWPRAVEGRLPNFRRLLEDGASLSLATVRPTQPGPVWASIASGMYPARTGVRAAATYYARGDHLGMQMLPDHCFSHALVYLGIVREEPRTSTNWQERPLWSILARAGMTVGLVRWPLTHPAADVPGFMVSDRYHALQGTVTEITRSVFPPGLMRDLHGIGHGTTTGPAALAAASLSSPAGAPERSALARDGLYSDIARRLASDVPPRFFAIRFTGLDTIGHHYLEYGEPPRLREVLDEERRRKVQIIERYHAYLDDEVGAALAGLREQDLLVVVSGFGMQRQNPLKRAVDRLLGGADFSGTHERGPDGFLLAYGASVAPGSHPRGAIVDVAPTLLYFMGLPVARDMDGFARTDLFTRAFTAERPIVFIPSYSR